MGIKKAVEYIKGFRDRELCLWLIPTSSGKVKKIRVSLFMACVSVIAIFALVSSVSFTLSEYAKLKSGTRSIKESLTRLMSGDQKYTGDDSLYGRVTYLAAERQKSQIYQEQLKERLTILGALLESNTSFNDLFDSISNSDHKDVGGAEVECSDSAEDGLPCLARVDEIRAGLRSDFASLSTKHNFTKEPDLIHTLDNFNTALKKLPLMRPINGWQTSGFGLRKSPFTRKVSRHQGLDFSAPYRTDVFSTADGVVKRVVRSKAYGLMIDVQHTDRIVTRYAHLLSAEVKTGQKVCRGQILAMSGSSGRSTGPHLHYEIRIDNTPVDPQTFISLGKSIGPELLDF